MKNIIYLAPILCLIFGIAGGELVNNFDRFQCDRKKIGSYYADLSSHCTKFHACVIIPNFGVRDFLFHCPLGTQFDQEAQICNDWGDVDCGQAYDLASSFGVYDNIFGKKSNSKISSLHLTNQVTQKPVSLNLDRKINIVASNNLDSQNSNNDDSDLFQGSYSSNFFQRRNDVLSDLKYDKSSQQQPKSHNRKLNTQNNANSIPITTEKQQNTKVAENKKIASNNRNNDIKVPTPYNNKNNYDKTTDIKITFNSNNNTSNYQYNQQINRKTAKTNVYQVPTTYKPQIQDYKTIEARTRSNQRGQIRQNSRQNNPRFIEKTTTTKPINNQTTSEANLLQNDYKKINNKDIKQSFATSTDSIIRTTKLQKTKNQTTTEIPSRKSRIQQSNYKYNLSSPIVNFPLTDDSQNIKINHEKNNKFDITINPNYNPEKVQKFDSSTKTYVFPDKTQKFENPIKTNINSQKIQKYDSTTTTKSNSNLEKIQKFDTSTKIYINPERFQKFDSTTKSNINPEKIQNYDNTFKSKYNLEKSLKFDITTKSNRNFDKIQKPSNIQDPKYDTTTKYNNVKLLNRNDGVKYSGTTEFTQSSFKTPKSYFDKTSIANYSPSGFVTNKPQKQSQIQFKDNSIVTTTTQRGFKILNGAQKTSFKETSFQVKNANNKQIKISGKSKQNSTDDDNYDYAYYDSARDPADYEDINVDNDFKRTTKRN